VISYAPSGSSERALHLPAKARLLLVESGNGEQTIPAPLSLGCVPLLACPNTVQNKFAEFLPKILECASHAGALGAEAMLPPMGARSMGSHRKGGSTAPAIQGAEASILTGCREKSWTVLGLSSSGALRQEVVVLSPPRHAMEVQ
jgi:hypothetical protein